MTIKNNRNTIDTLPLNASLTSQEEWHQNFQMLLLLFIYYKIIQKVQKKIESTKLQKIPNDKKLQTTNTINKRSRQQTVKI